MPKYKVMFCRFPGDHREESDCTDWFVKSMLQAKADPRVEKVMSWYISDTPITMGRNRAIEIARSHGADFVVMVDSDMKPDMYVGHDPKAKPFFPLALDFLINHQGPAMIAVPYCGPPPRENIYIFLWATKQSDHPNPDLTIDQYTREQAAVATGIEEVAALPTGLCMFHLSAVDRLNPPYFYYEWARDAAGRDIQAEKASTEDVTFTRDLAFAGVPIYVAWDCWAGHWKRKCVGRPGRINVKDVSEKYVNTIKTALLAQGWTPPPPPSAPTTMKVVDAAIRDPIAEAKKAAVDVITRGQESKRPADQEVIIA
jgi:hypothetical protein